MMRARTINWHQFLSTPSVGRATNVKDTSARSSAISIHALRGEGDDITSFQLRKNFRFLSTPSVGRATTGRRSTTRPACISIHALRGEGDGVFFPCPTDDRISIHALRGEGDAGRVCHVAGAGEFLSTPSVGRATSGTIHCNAKKFISIHALRGEGDTTPSSLI